MESLKKIKVRAVLVDENDYMALMYLPKFEFNNYNDYYMLPGGSIEANEDLEKALEREMLEETGCRINIIKELTHTVEERGYDNSTIITHYYLAKVTGEKGQHQMTELENEYKTELQWHSLEKALDIIANQAPGAVSEAIKDMCK